MNILQAIWECQPPSCFDRISLHEVKFKSAGVSQIENEPNMQQIETFFVPYNRELENLLGESKAHVIARNVEHFGERKIFEASRFFSLL